MENISRRRALALLPAAGVTVAAPVAAVASSVETAERKAQRLQRELADVLNEAWGGRFGAEVFPSRDIPHDVGGKFFDTESHCRQWREAQTALAYVEMTRHGEPMDRARNHAQQLTLAMREHHGPAEVLKQWYGDKGFLVVRPGLDMPIMRVPGRRYT